MYRLGFPVILIIVAGLFSGYAGAEVAHPKNNDIVGLASGNSVCFNNDGVIASPSECDTTSVDEGYVYISKSAQWAAGSDSGINGCGTSPVSPVTSATCPYTTTNFAACTGNGYVLVQTTKSGHFWIVRADSGCTTVTKPEATALIPCLSSDGFDPIKGCYAGSNPPVMTIEEGYIQLDTYGEPPPVSHCNNDSEYGRMAIDSVNGLIYICTQAGWLAK
jgi:hypothetical protein